MIEHILTVTMTIGSAFLFAYWFRYTCLLILSAETARDYATEVATTLGLDFPEVHARLRLETATNASINLDELQTRLDRDYAVVTHLLKNVVVKSATASGVEVKMMEIHYKVLAAWFSISKRLSANSAQSALEEMSRVVTFFANTIGQRTEAVLGA